MLVPGEGNRATYVVLGVDTFPQYIYHIMTMIKVTTTTMATTVTTMITTTTKTL